MEIETGGWAGHRRLVVCIVSNVFEASSGNCVCSNVKDKFLVPLCIGSHLQHTCVTMGTQALLQSHGQRWHSHDWSSWKSPQGSHMLQGVPQQQITHGSPSSTVGGERGKGELPKAQLSQPLEKVKGPVNGFLILKKKNQPNQHMDKVLWKINLDVYVYREIHRYMCIIIICYSCPNLVKGQKFSQTTWWWKLSALTKCWENCFRLSSGYSKWGLMLEVLIILQVKRKPKM